MQALQQAVRDVRAAHRDPFAEQVTERMMIDLAFALRDTMRRAGPVRHQSADGGSTLELKHSAISHRGFAFEVKRRTYMWEDVRPHVRRLKREHPAFLQLLEHPGDITWVDALRAQDALRELWGLMRPVEEPQLKRREMPRLELPPVALKKKVKKRPTWKKMAVVERGELASYDFALAAAAELGRHRRDRPGDKPLRRRWEKDRCVIEMQI